MIMDLIESTLIRLHVDEDGNVSDEEEQAVNAELGIFEDHFSKPDGSYGMNVSDLELAIAGCKEMIFETEERSAKRLTLVRKLTKLRFTLQELKDEPPVPPGIRKYLGHHLEPQRPTLTTHHVCDKCVGMIWTLIPGNWYRCKFCNYKTHHACIPLIQRSCPSVSKFPTYLLQICQEKGLSAQAYRCGECRVPVTLSKYRLCDYNGLYYCANCHWNNLAVIPARIVRNWDFTPQFVCRASKQLLKMLQKRPILALHALNPMLFCYVEELNELKRLREELLMMKNYLQACRVALETRLLRILDERLHFVDHCDMYSVQDLIDLKDGSLLTWTTGVHDLLAKHIKEECEVCRGQGHLCGLCDGKNEILYPFDKTSSVCPMCSAVFHRECYMKFKGNCARCNRRASRQGMM
ncbi:unnamed protein product [Notodromas monacha]|uniref:Phorbol-ester/DAG-type domain-containing protein n=1 Tax=Notodromas monacha TaxID=399045 RepID=A0A7R9BCA3_9CRUS|nr:unnamed protein product [Notodromas monacha]CAG0912657.1 unnamed protein product [Notodromas monacha]